MILTTFFDSSAYAKLFIVEVGSQEMMNFFLASRPNSLAVSELVYLEVRSALRRRQQEGQLKESDADHAVLQLYDSTLRIHRIGIASRIYLEAANLIDRYSLRALDSIQLSSALSLGPPSQTRFISSDQKLLRAAVAEGFPAWNPADGPCPS